MIDRVKNAVVENWCGKEPGSDECDLRSRGDTRVDEVDGREENRVTMWKTKLNGCVKDCLAS